MFLLGFSCPDYIISDIRSNFIHDWKFEIKLNISIFHPDLTCGCLCAYDDGAWNSTTKSLQMKYTLLFTLTENNRVNTPYKPKAKHSHWNAYNVTLCVVPVCSRLHIDAFNPPLRLVPLFCERALLLFFFVWWCDGFSDSNNLFREI